VLAGWCYDVAHSQPFSCESLHASMCFFFYSSWMSAVSSTRDCDRACPDALYMPKSLGSRQGLHPVNWFTCISAIMHTVHKTKCH
jgi:hypothetical protein